MSTNVHYLVQQNTQKYLNWNESLKIRQSLMTRIPFKNAIHNLNRFCVIPIDLALEISTHAPLQKDHSKQITSNKKMNKIKYISN